MSPSQPLPLPKLARTAKRALADAGLRDLGAVARVTEAELANLHGMGPKALGALRAALEAHGLSFAGRPVKPRA